MKRFMFHVKRVQFGVFRETGSIHADRAMPVYGCTCARRTLRTPCTWFIMLGSVTASGWYGVPVVVSCGDDAAVTDCANMVQDAKRAQMIRNASCTAPPTHLFLVWAARPCRLQGRHSCSRLLSQMYISY